MADEFKAETRDAFIHSKLPTEPDSKAIDALLLKINRWEIDKIRESTKSA